MTPSWQNNLHAIWRHLQSNASARVALLGMGQELRGDDAAGVLVANHLAILLANRPDMLVINAGPAPENFTGPLRRFNPALVVLIDAAQMGGESGEISWLEADQLDGFAGSTHTLPPNVLASYLAAETGCQVALIGIQAGDMELGARPSPAVLQAAEEVARGIVEALGES